MRPDARAAAAIDILDVWLAGEEGLDRLLTRWGRDNRYAGSGDRHAIADLVYGAVRRKRSAQWVCGAEDPASGRALVLGSALLDGVDPETLFTGARHAPAPLTVAERRQRPLDTAPAPVRDDVPDWLAAHVAPDDREDLDALRHRAALDLRANLLRTDRASAARALAEEGIATEPHPTSDTALRVTEGARKVQRSTAYLDGLVEIQDAASQAIADLIEARPGQRVLDLCAGGGGKALAIAARTGNTCEILAHDIAPARLAQIPERAARAGAVIHCLAPGDLEHAARNADVVLIDAPCSGSGAWRRNPDAKWRLGLADLNRLTALQDRLLRQGADLVAPDGRLVYATCSILAAENTQRVAAFVDGTPGWSRTSQTAMRPRGGTDGLYGAVLHRS